VDELKKIWTDAPWYLRALLVVAAPVTLVFIIYTTVSGGLDSLANSSALKQLSQRDKDFQASIDKNKTEATQAEAKVDLLESERAEAVKNEANHDAVDFHNSKKPV
jgi:cell division protein FtsB